MSDLVSSCVDINGLFCDRYFYVRLRIKQGLHLFFPTSRDLKIDTESCVFAVKSTISPLDTEEEAVIYTHEHALGAALNEMPSRCKGTETPNH